jgi:hypothetical protein
LSPRDDAGRSARGRRLLVCAAALAAGICTLTSAAAPAQTLQELQAQRVDWRFGMYIHFNMNTFYPGWANDRVDPKMFNPTKLDCTQWAAAAKSAGMKFAALTTKHHDGFALWPSKQTPPNGKAPYTIAQSSVPTRDVVKEYVDAFRAAGIAPGLYFSLWDVANGIGGSYSTTDTINWDAVKGYVLGQLTEFLSNYGEIPLLIFATVTDWPQAVTEIADAAGLQDIYKTSTRCLQGVTDEGAGHSALRLPQVANLQGDSAMRAYNRSYERAVHQIVFVQVVGREVLVGSASESKRPVSIAAP